MDVVWEIKQVYGRMTTDDGLTPDPHPHKRYDATLTSADTLTKRTWAELLRRKFYFPALLHVITCKRFS